MNTVRRLTPLECTRLQGYPDGWVEIGDWTDSKGKLHKDADSPKYKALGNSIALPFWGWLAGRICERYDRPVTMGSLFDGIGGFPKVFQNHGATPVWASEIEEYPIAVTKRRFPDDCIVDFGGEKILLNKVSELLPDITATEYQTLDPIEMACEVSEESKKMLEEIMRMEMPKVISVKDGKLNVLYVRLNVVLETILRYKCDPDADGKTRTEKGAICDAIISQLLNTVYSTEDDEDEI